jgi:glycerophosphoryl diester phosphodiesterase
MTWPCELGADYIEQDLQMTSDGVLVVMHDETLDRTSGGRCTRPGHRSYARADPLVRRGIMVQHHVPEHARENYVDARIPTLEEVFERYADRASFYIETKNPEEAPGMEEALLALLDRFDLREPAAREWRVLIQSFSERSLRMIHDMDPSLPLIQLLYDCREVPQNIGGRLEDIRSYAVGIGPYCLDVDERLGRAAADLCLELHPYTVNDSAMMQPMTAAGVTGMFTDVPDVLLARLPADEPRGRSGTVRRCGAQPRVPDERD